MWRGSFLGLPAVGNPGSYRTEAGDSQVVERRQVEDTPTPVPLDSPCQALERSASSTSPPLPEDHHASCLACVVFVLCRESRCHQRGHKLEARQPGREVPPGCGGEEGRPRDRVLHWSGRCRC
ncbi:hypothetical protein E2C01_071645 [Portunus trituberculatus]|uniref:Uncharacterized protein n=1 Tax=Portunus trituberculatus TaxID=210409 RepID=A0A5B7I6S0_PORTR|nr:hypothetical protein [Portunus trituberculatus]